MIVNGEILYVTIACNVARNADEIQGQWRAPGVTLIPKHVEKGQALLIQRELRWFRLMLCESMGRNRMDRKAEHIAKFTIGCRNILKRCEAVSAVYGTAERSTSGKDTAHFMRLDILKVSDRVSHAAFFETMVVAGVPTNPDRQMIEVTRGTSNFAVVSNGNVSFEGSDAPSRLHTRCTSMLTILLVAEHALKVFS